MTAYAWWLTTWGRIRETLQPELFVLRGELRQARDERDTARAVLLEERNIKRIAQRNATELSKQLTQHAREIKAARAAVKRARK